MKKRKLGGQKIILIKAFSIKKGLPLYRRMLKKPLFSRNAQGTENNFCQSKN